MMMTMMIMIMMMMIMMMIMMMMMMMIIIIMMMMMMMILVMKIMTCLGEATPDRLYGFIALCECVDSRGLCLCIVFIVVSSCS